jgi:protein HIRA/HIR1
MSISFYRNIVRKNVSCDVGLTMILFRNAEKFPELVTTLRGHTGLVKGVVFDPVGKYLASQSDDKTLRVWRTSDWTQETLIEKPFAEAGATTHVLRFVFVPNRRNSLTDNKISRTYFVKGGLN